MPKKVNFTKRVIADLKPPAEGRTYLYDAKQAGLCLCITASGVRTWYRYGRIDGRPERVKLGRYPDVSVENARKAAAGVAGDVAKGIDPRRKKSKAPTLADLFAHWIAHAKGYKKTAAEDQRKWDTYFSRLKTKRLADVSQGDVATWHRRLGEKRGHYLANRCRALLSAMFNRAGEIGYTGPNPCAGVKRFREESRERFLLPDETKPFFAALKTEPPTWRDFWLLALFTGARRGNVASMAWKDLDLGQGIWFIAGQQTKNGLPLAVVLPPPAVVILKARQADRNGSPYVFQAETATGYIVDPRKSWARVLKAAGMDKLPGKEKLRPHDLRRSLGSWQALAGASLQVIGQSLGHRDVKSTAVYARLLMDPVRTSVNGAVQAMLTAAEGGDDEQV